MKLDLLYLFGFSPRITDRLNKLQGFISHQIKAGKTVGIAFLHDGVVGAGPGGSCPDSVIGILKNGVRIFALGPDLDARGFKDKQLEKGIQRINYDELMQLIVDSTTLCSWM